jgi:phosphatidylinositol-3,4,5-trisphosphate 3-phosphatase/dual-specificity protein phosphatase PTEN
MLFYSLSQAHKVPSFLSSGVLFSSKKHHRTKHLLTEDIWFSAPRKGVVVFALPGERCVADLNGDFKVHFNDRHGDFYWLVLPPSISCF